MLDISNLTCGYDSGFAIRNIDLRVPAGEIIGIIGPNGSGKTTLLRAITRSLAPSGGVIRLEGADIRRIRIRDIARKIAVVSQSAESGFMTVEEFVLMGRTPYYNRFRFMETRRDAQIAENAMALTDALRLKNQLMSQISGGERQLALIARALAQEPKLLLLDEPTTYLDITHQVAILDLIRRLNINCALTVLMVLHDLNLAGEYCHRLALFNKGSIYKFGTPEEVLDYRIIEEVYKTVVVVEKNPISNKPYVMAISEAAQEANRKLKSAQPAKKTNS
jgi:iron complex transport system ATP-binding protein